MKRPRWLVAVAAGTALLAAACSGAGNGSGAGGSAANAVTISNESGGLWNCGFSPYNPNVNFLSDGLVYEPLLFMNTLENGKITPWLASSYKFSDGNRKATFTIRKGVKWSDGQPFTPADVVFSFDLLKRHAALDLSSVWSVLSSVTQQGSDKVVMTFKYPSVPSLYNIADQVGIVPEHIWSKVSNPIAYPDSSPVGTGPYLVQKCSPQNITYVRNPHYWQPGLPKVAKVEYPAFTSNDSANEYLATGQAQWGGQFIPSIQHYYTSKSSGYHYWFAPVANVGIFVNQTVSPLNNVAVRQAISYAIDRPRVSQIGEYGYEPPANQSGIVTPTFNSWVDSSLTKTYNYSFNPLKAIAVLQHAGFKRSGGVFVSPTGQKLDFTIINLADYPDWIASLQVISQELASVGIRLNVDNLSSDDFDADLYDGKFQLAYNAESTIGPSPYYELRDILYGPASAPIGQSAASNWERFHSAAADRLINGYGDTTSTARQHQIVDQLEKVMLTQLPMIPVTEQVDWYEYDSGHFTGWATQSDPYAQPSPYQVPDDEVILLHLRPKV